ncbi:UbiA prenyltransferase family domain-containing protein [Trichoderma compactum]
MPPSKVSALPRYSPPTEGLLSYLPASWVPYVELTRFEKPHGIYMILYPYIMGLLYAAKIAPAPIPLQTFISRTIGLTIWTVFFRSAGCAWNDNVDQDYDRKTARCCTRPIARGAISTLQGHIFTTVLVLFGFLSIQDLPVECKMDATVALALACIYPFGKRFTHFAQVPLGATLSMAIILSQHSVGINPFSEENILPTACLVTSIIMLVMFYDVVYARQDTADDLKSGVKGMAVLFRNWIKTLLVSLVAGITTLLYTAGQAVGMSTLFFQLSVAGPAISLITMVTLMSINSKTYAWYTGKCYVLAIACLLSGFAAEYYTRAV